MERMQPKARGLRFLPCRDAHTGNILVHCHDCPRYAVQIRGAAGRNASGRQVSHSAVRPSGRTKDAVSIHASCFPKIFPIFGQMR
jgi:hypothetical protein